MTLKTAQSPNQSDYYGTYNWYIQLSLICCRHLHFSFFSHCPSIHLIAICGRGSILLPELVILTCSCCPYPWCRYCEEIPAEDNEANDNCPKTPDTKMDISPQLHRKVFPNSSLNSTDSTDAPVNVRTGSPSQNTSLRYSRSPRTP